MRMIQSTICKFRRTISITRITTKRKWNAGSESKFISVISTKSASSFIGIVQYIGLSRVQCDARCLAPPSWKLSRRIKGGEKGSDKVVSPFRTVSCFLVLFNDLYLSRWTLRLDRSNGKRDARAAKIPIVHVRARLLMKYFLSQRYAKFYPTTR